MSIPVEIIGSSVGSFVGAVYQFTATLNSLAGGSNMLLQVIIAAVVILLSYKILQQIWGTLMLLFKVIAVLLILSLGFQAYERGFDASLQSAQVFASQAYKASIQVALASRAVLTVLMKHLEATAKEAWEEAKKNH